MTDAEMGREINWRIDTLPPGDAAVLARYVERLLRTELRWRAAAGRPLAVMPPGMAHPR